MNIVNICLIHDSVPFIIQFQFPQIRNQNLIFILDMESLPNPSQLRQLRSRDLEFFLQEVRLALFRGCRSKSKGPLNSLFFHDCSWTNRSIRIQCILERKHFPRDLQRLSAFLHKFHMNHFLDIIAKPWLCLTGLRNYSGFFRQSFYRAHRFLMALPLIHKIQGVFFAKTWTERGEASELNK